MLKKTLSVLTVTIALIELGFEIHSIFKGDDE